MGHDGLWNLIGTEAYPCLGRSPLSKKYQLGEMDRERLSLRPKQFYADNDNKWTTWQDFLLLLVITVFVATIWFRIEGTLNYKWRWERIPSQILCWNEDEGRWVANVLVQGYNMADMATVGSQSCKELLAGM